jgi:hypothetical protein
MSTGFEETTPEPKWSKSRPGTKRSMMEALEGFAAEDRIWEFLSTLPPHAALATATWAAHEAGRRFTEADIPRGVWVAKISMERVDLVARCIEQFPTVPEATRFVLWLIRDLQTDLGWIVTSNVLRQLTCRHWRDVQH